MSRADLVRRRRSENEKTYDYLRHGGDSVAFLGDSITDFGWTAWWAGGYVKMCEAAFKDAGLDVKIHPAGIGGNKSDQMLARLDRDVISKKPTWMTLSCGVNDVGHQHYENGVYVKGGVLLPDFKKNITAIIDRAQAAGIKVIVLTATMNQEDENSAQNKRLVPYNEFLRAIANEKGCALVDVGAEMRRQVAEFRAKTGSAENFLTNDGVHMDYLGNVMMAQKILKDGFAFSEDEMAKANVAILTVPAYLPVNSVKVSGETYLKVTEKAKAANQTPSRYARPILTKAAEKGVEELIGK